jgi:hypothetical protein
MNSPEPIGHLFPMGGPASPDVMLGRREVVDDLRRRIGEGIHTLITGRRRIGKTTVCNAVCEGLASDGTAVIEIEVPESLDSGALLQMLVDRSRGRNAVREAGVQAFKLAEPLLNDYLTEKGIPLDLSQLFKAGPAPESVEAILSLPRRLAKATGSPVVLYLDELQRAGSYEDGSEILTRLVDLYAGRTDVVLLVDGSEERAIEKMMGPPVSFGKLADRMPLTEEIPLRVWRQELPDRFRRAGLAIDRPSLDGLLEFGAEQPYATMAAARFAATFARQTSSDAVGDLEVCEGIAAAERHLKEDPR